MKSTSSVFALAFASTLLSGHSAVIDILPGTNNVPITKVTYNNGITDIEQTAPVAATPANKGVADRSDAPLVVTAVQVNDGTLINLQFINTEGSTVRNVNPEFNSIGGQPSAPGTPGIGVFDNGLVTFSKNNVPTFADSVAATTLDADLRHFVFYDYLDSTPTLGTPDYDLVYNRAMTPDDYILVSERNGNTYFEITPLKADGTPYADANVLRFGGSGGAAYDVYDWNSGYAAASNESNQAQAFSVASVAKFFEGTTETPGPVFGFRIDNDGEADTKILVISDNSFEDNPRLVPEPSALLMTLSASFMFAFSRKRQRP